jgi:hypothetical protein
MESNAKQLENKQVIVTDIDALIAHIKGLEAEKAELLSVLSDLLDEQNGPPIWSRANEWQAVCDKARMLIENAEKTLP